MNTQEEIINQAAEQLAKEIDFDVMSTLLCESGWTKVILKPMTMERGDNIDIWLETKCRGRNMNMGLVFLFEDARDATWFTLKYGTPE